MKRRKFLKTSTGSALALAVLSASIPKVEAAKLKMMATNWGFVGTHDDFCKAAKKEGYDGIEIWFPDAKEQQELVLNALKKHQLEIGFLCGGNQKNAKEHLQSFKEAVIGATKFGIKPLYINCHSGKDFFSFEENQPFIEFTTLQEKATGITICHETHRGRMLFAAHITKKFIDQNPKLNLTLDISHWCNVHESMLEDQAESVELALSRTAHIHARVGHAEGPQVNDPRAPEWEFALKKHIEWWDIVVERRVKNGEIVTILTEFGPPSYLQTLPFTNQPVADQWGINVYMMKFLKERYIKK